MTLDIAGETLAQRLARRTLGLAELAPILDDALSVLVDRHARNAVHRSITPDVLLLEQPTEALGVAGRDRTRLLDSKSTPTHVLEPDLRPFETTLSGFAYMAPEQVRGSSTVDARADLYALGVVAFRALTGRVPFEATNALVLVALKLERDPPTLEQASGAPWPPDLERFVATMMARDRAARYPSAAVALAAWRALPLFGET